MTHDHDAIMAMLARYAADDTEWDRPMVLFALGRNPGGAYGIAPIRPWNSLLSEAINDYGFMGAGAISALADMADRTRATLPGLDVATIAFNICHADPQMRRYFPAAGPETEPCGVVMRTEAWTIPGGSDVEIPPGGFADHPDATETLEYLAVSDDDHFMQVSWHRGAAAPKHLRWSFADSIYRDHKHQQRIATDLRTLMQVNCAAVQYNREHPKDVPPWLKNG